LDDSSTDDSKSLNFITALISLGAQINKSNWLGENVLSLSFIHGRDRVASYFLALRLLSLNPHERMGIKCSIIDNGSFTDGEVVTHPNNIQNNVSPKKANIVFYSPHSLLGMNVFHFAFMVSPKTVLQALQWSPLIKNYNNQDGNVQFGKLIDYIGPSSSLSQKDCFGRTPLLVMCMWDGIKCVGGEPRVCK
jgi:hypothetical protein